MSKVVQYLFLNRGLNMSSGKLAAQAAHASVESYRVSDPKLITKWREAKHYTKLTMLAEDEDHLRSIERYLNERNIKTCLIIDEGLTEFNHTHKLTALGCELVDKEDPEIPAIFSSFSIYKDQFRVTIELDK